MIESLTLITGANGFIGLHLTRALVKQGRKVRCLIEKNSDRACFEGLPLEIIESDLNDKNRLLKAVDNVEVVYHLAAKIRSNKFLNNHQKLEEEFSRVNVLGTINLVEACQKSETKKFLYFSSYSVTAPGVGPVENAVYAPATIYEKTKCAAERFIIEQVTKSKFPAVIIRPGYVYGPGSKMMLEFFRLAEMHVHLLACKGIYIIPLCYIDDLVEASLLAEKSGEKGQVYVIIQNGYTPKLIFETVSEIMGKRFFRVYIPKFCFNVLIGINGFLEKFFNFRMYPFKQDINSNILEKTLGFKKADSSKTRESLGFYEKTSLKEGIEKTMRWYYGEDLL